MTENKDAIARKIWEWCGFTRYDLWSTRGQGWKAPNGDKFPNTPELTLDNLFKYAVPKLCAGDRYSVKIYTHKYNTEVCILSHYADHRNSLGNNPDPAEALAQAILKVIENEEGK